MLLYLIYLDLRLDNNNNHTRDDKKDLSRQIHFPLCESCFWCASYIHSKSVSVAKCPNCYSNKIEWMPIPKVENQRIVVMKTIKNQENLAIKEHVLRQHAGWSGRSQMHLKYLHYFGNESSESLLEAYGIITKDQQSSVDILKPKQCPNCNEPNKPDSRFCSRCRMVLTYDAYNETVEEKAEKDKEVQALKEQVSSMQSAQKEILELLKDPDKLLAALKRDRWVE